MNADRVLELAGDALQGVINLIGLAGAIALVFVAMWLVIWLIWRLNRARVNACATQLARALSLQSVPSKDRRVCLWRGQTAEHELWLATPVIWEGPSGLMLDAAGPGFDEDAPRLAFARVVSLVLVARHREPMPDAFVLSNLRGANATLRTGDPRFDAAFRLSGSRETAVLRIFSNAPLRDALLAIFGPDRRPDGRGLLVALNERGLAICWDGPRAARVSELARAVPEALRRLSARRDFF